MTLRFNSEEDLRKLGFRPLNKQTWIPNLRDGHRRKKPRPKRDVLSKTERQNRKKAEIKAGIRYRIRFTVYRHKLLDWINLSAGLKIYEDKLVEKGILADDCPQLMLYPDIDQIEIKKEEKERVLVQVYRFE